MSSSKNKDIPRSFRVFTQHVIKKIDDLINYRYRALVVISSKDPVKLGKLASYIINRFSTARFRRSKVKLRGLYIYHDEFREANLLREVFEKYVESRRIDMEFGVYEKSEKYLGTTFQLLVMDLTKDLKPNDVGRLIGVVEGGGLIALLTPPWTDWDRFLTIFKTELLVPQMPEPRHVFITWFKNKLMEHEGIGIYDADEERILKKYELKRKPLIEKKEIVIPSETLFPRRVYEFSLTMDQVNVVKLMETLFEKPRKGMKKVIVITADRGRGKSCAIGIGVSGLIHLLKKVKPRPRVLVTAPEPSNVQSFMTLVMKVLDDLGYKYEIIKKEGSIVELRGEKFSVEYWKPIDIPRLKGDIIVVDEASGIHVPMLHKIWKSHNRLVFSTTIHGYEGAGRGFSVRFLQKIKSDEKTVVYEYEMSEPIRYSYNDPIEEWQFKTLLLDAEPAELDDKDLKDIETGNLVYVKYKPEELFRKENEDELRQLFGIYVLAHYRNEPDDLGMLADAPHHSIRAVKTSSGRVVCAIQIAFEGGIGEDMVYELLRGGKIPGNIIPDRFLKHLRYVGFAKLKGWRIVRIATHPSVQGKGIGSWALSKLYEEAVDEKLDWVAAGFGVNAELLRFWLKNGFIPVHISPDRNQVSGEYTLLVIKPITEECMRYVNLANIEFRIKLLESLHINYRDLEVDVAKQLLETGEPLLKELPRDLFTPVQIDRLWTYCSGPMTFESASDIMGRIARIYWSLPIDRKPKLNTVEEYVLIGKSMEGISWEELEEILNIPVKELHKIMRRIACVFFEYLTGKKIDEHTPGVENTDYNYTLCLFT
ncbi:MAG: tRNA(Met) cytidine acetyltransferase TmcA [Desulfurococcaceae archaeon]